MRHQTKKHTLGKAQDQRKALLRSLATELFVNGEITTTLARAKALKPYAEKVISLAKKGDLNSIRQAAKYIYNKETGKYMDLATGEVFEAPQADKKLASQTVLRKLFVVIGKQYSEKNGGYDPDTGLHYSGAKFYVGFGDSPWDAESTGLSVSDGSISLRAESQIWIGCDNGVFLYGDVQVNDKKVATLNDIPTNLVYRNNNGFSQCTGDPSSMVCILNGELRYITKSTIKSWLGIS